MSFYKFAWVHLLLKIMQLNPWFYILSNAHRDDFSLYLNASYVFHFDEFCHQSAPHESQYTQTQSCRVCVCVGKAHRYTLFRYTMHTVLPYVDIWCDYKREMGINKSSSARNRVKWRHGRENEMDENWSESRKSWRHKRFYIQIHSHSRMDLCVGKKKLLGAFKGCFFCCCCCSAICLLLVCASVCIKWTPFSWSVHVSCALRIRHTIIWILHLDRNVRANNTEWFRKSDFVFSHISTTNLYRVWKNIVRFCGCLCKTVLTHSGQLVTRQNKKFNGILNACVRVCVWFSYVFFITVFIVNSLAYRSLRNWIHQDYTIIEFWINVNQYMLQSQWTKKPINLNRRKKSTSSTFNTKATSALSMLISSVLFYIFN